MPKSKPQPQPSVYDRSCGYAFCDGYAFAQMEYAFAQTGYAAMEPLHDGAIQRPAEENGPFRIIHVGQYMFRAGIENWLKALNRCCDPRRLRFLRCVVTSKIAEPSVVAEMGIPVEVGGAKSVQRAARDCDVLLCSGPAELAGWLDQERPKLCLFVAHGEGLWTRNILRASAQVFDHVIAVSQRVKRWACQELPTTVIYNGVDLTHLTHSRPREHVRQSLGFSPGDFVLGFVGRFSVEKRPETIIEAVARLPRRFKALLVGWGPLRQKLMDLANECIPGRYAFVKGQSHLGDYYGAMDAFCLTSQWEGFGLVLLEAMFCERPVIAGRIGFAPEGLKDGVNCLMVDGGPDSVSQAALTLRQYPEGARGLARQAKIYAEQHGHAFRMCQQYADVIERLWLEKHGRRFEG